MKKQVDTKKFQSGEKVMVTRRGKHFLDVGVVIETHPPRRLRNEVNLTGLHVHRLYEVEHSDRSIRFYESNMIEYPDIFINIVENKLKEVKEKNGYH